MDAADVPQEDIAIFRGEKLRAVFARAENGRLESMKSSGWHVEETINRQARQAFDDLIDAARERVRAGQSSPLEFHMYRACMDIPLLAKVSGLWRWQVRRHMRPAVFSRLSSALRMRYAQTFSIEPDQLDVID